MKGAPPGGRPSSLLPPLAGFRAGAPSGTCSPSPRGRLAIPTHGSPSAQTPAGIRAGDRPDGGVPPLPPAGVRGDPLRSRPDLAKPPARRSRRSTAAARSVSSPPKRLSGIPGLATPRGRNRKRENGSRGEDFPGGAEAAGSSSCPRVS